MSSGVYFSLALDLLGVTGLNFEQIDSFVNLFSDSLKRLGNGLGVFGRLHSAFKDAAKNVQTLTIAEVAEQNAEKLGTVRAYLYATGVKAMAMAHSILSTAILGCPLGWLIGGLAAVGGAVAGVMWLFGAFRDNVAENARAMEELCNQNDIYRTSAKKCMTTLEEFSKIESVDANQKKASLSNWNELQRTAEALEINLAKLGITFDEHTGKVNASAQAMARFKEAMRQKEIEDLNNAIQAQEKELDKLNDKLHNGKTGFWRTVGTYVTFGFVDNAEEIQKQINEKREKLQDNLERQKVVVDFSAEYKENEAKLQEMYDKEAEASKNALAVKIDNIKTEFSEREAILRQLIQEAEVRDSLSFEDMEKLRERRAALAGLNAEQEKRIQLLRDEQAEKYPLQDVTA